MGDLLATPTSSDSKRPKFRTQLPIFAIAPAMRLYIV
jgi:hypothetical protein